MSTAPSTNSKPAPAVNKLIPPEERFWKRYSAHGEAPLSMSGSLALHALVFGGVFLFSVYLASIWRPTRSLPVEAVRLQIEGGGGGKPDGVGDGKGIGKAAENVPEKSEDPGTQKDAKTERAALKPVEMEKVKQEFAPADARIFQDTNSDSAKAFARLDQSLRNKLRDGMDPGKGQGGPGSGGGQGTGQGTGKGSGKGPGRANLTPREKRMLRWHLQFEVPRDERSGPEYLGQMRDLKAILAFPYDEAAGVPKFKVVRDLQPGAKLLDEDVARLNRIYWINDNPSAVQEILQALGITLSPLPSRFVAFMPPELEQRLYDMERDHVTKVLKRAFAEDQILETNFQVVKMADGTRVRLKDVLMKK